MLHTYIFLLWKIFKQVANISFLLEMSWVFEYLLRVKLYFINSSNLVSSFSTTKLYKYFLPFVLYFPSSSHVYTTTSSLIMFPYVTDFTATYRRLAGRTHLTYSRDAALMMKRCSSQTAHLQTQVAPMQHMLSRNNAHAYSSLSIWKRI